MSEKIKFRILNEKHERFFAPTGEKTEIRHEPEIGKDGKRVLKPTRVVEIYNLIQEGREQTEIQYIMKRAMEGDANVLNAMNGVYADISDAPKSLAEAQQLIINAKREFENLPIEIKRKFNMNPEEYVAQVGTKEWLDAMGVTHKFEELKAIEEENKKLNENTKKAMEQLATGAGTVITQGGVTNE